MYLKKLKYSKITNTKFTLIDYLVLHYFLGILDNKKWILKGLIILIRHGDRGPLQHVKKISNINCNTEETTILSSYKVGLL